MILDYNDKNHNIRKEMDSGKLCGAVFVDLCKAFDVLLATVP